MCVARAMLAAPKCNLGSIKARSPIIHPQLTDLKAGWDNDIAQKRTRELAATVNKIRTGVNELEGLPWSSNRDKETVCLTI